MGHVLNTPPVALQWGLLRTPARKGKIIEQVANARRDVALKMTVLSRQMAKRFTQSVDEHGVTRSQWSMIAVVARRPGATQRGIAEALDMTEAAAGRGIDRLCQDGLLVRKQRTDDRRAYSVELTDAALPILDRLSATAQVEEARAFAGVSDAQLAAMAQVLDQIYANVTTQLGTG